MRPEWSKLKCSTLAGCDLSATAEKLANNQHSIIQFNSRGVAISLILFTNEARVEQIEVLHLGRLTYQPRLKNLPSTSTQSYNSTPKKGL
jgi:hypothetical protein